MKASKTICVFILFALILGLGFGVSVGHAQSGSLEPPGTAVDGSGDPVVTTQAQPSWDQSLPASERFVLVLPTTATPVGEAILDKETGLVWEQSPQTAQLPWISARAQCTSRSVGDKRGWRLPSVHELSSLLGPTVAGPDLPAGHPFSNVQTFIYWSATTNAVTATNAMNVNFANGVIGTSTKANSFYLAWCVRGGMGHGVVY